MALAYKDRILETSTTTGTGTYTLAGAVTGFQAFSAIGNANTCHYAAWEVDAAGNPSGGWEVGLGTYTLSGTTLARTTILASSNAGAAINWGAGTRRIACVNPADAIAATDKVPQNSQSAAYTLVLEDQGKHIYHPSADTTARIWTIPANSSVPFPIGTPITFVNDTSGGVITIAITSDTLVLAGSGSTGSRTLAANGVATALKVTVTRWIISGTGLS